MSNKKKENIHTGTRKKTNRKPLLEGPAARKILWIVNLVALAVLVLIIAFALSIRIGTAKPLPQETTAPTEMEQPEEPTEAPMNLNYGLTITDVGSYTGVYMEDGSDDIVSGVLMIEVTNTGEETAYFKLSTLPAGETVILLELNRMQYAADAEYSVAVVENVAIFRHELSVCEDKIQLQVLDGTMNVKNISGEDIDGDVIVYYKNYSSGIYYGGITYMIRIQGGMEADEVRQSAATHISPSGSRVMFVTCGA